MTPATAPEPTITMLSRIIRPGTARDQARVLAGNLVRGVQMTQDRGSPTTDRANITAQFRAANRTLTRHIGLDREFSKETRRVVQSIIPNDRLHEVLVLSSHMYEVAKVD